MQSRRQRLTTSIPYEESNRVFSPLMPYLADQNSPLIWEDSFDSCHPSAAVRANNATVHQEHQRRQRKAMKPAVHRASSSMHSYSCIPYVEGAPSSSSPRVRYEPRAAETPLPLAHEVDPSNSNLLAPMRPTLHYIKKLEKEVKALTTQNSSYCALLFQVVFQKDLMFLLGEERSRRSEIYEEEAQSRLVGFYFVQSEIISLTRTMEREKVVTEAKAVARRKVSSKNASVQHCAMQAEVSAPEPSATVALSNMNYLDQRLEAVAKTIASSVRNIVASDKQKTDDLPLEVVAAPKRDAGTSTPRCDTRDFGISPVSPLKFTRATSPLPVVKPKRMNMSTMFSPPLKIRKEVSTNTEVPPKCAETTSSRAASVEQNAISTAVVKTPKADAEAHAVSIPIPTFSTPSSVVVPRLVDANAVRSPKEVAKIVSHAISLSTRWPSHLTFAVEEWNWHFMDCAYHGFHAKCREYLSALPTSLKPSQHHVTTVSLSTQTDLGIDEPTSPTADGETKPKSRTLLDRCSPIPLPKSVSSQMNSSRVQEKDVRAPKRRHRITPPPVSTNVPHSARSPSEDIPPMYQAVVAPFIPTKHSIPLSVRSQLKPKVVLRSIGELRDSAVALGVPQAVFIGSATTPTAPPSPTASPTPENSFVTTPEKIQYQAAAVPELAHPSLKKQEPKRDRSQELFSSSLVPKPEVEKVSTAALLIPQFPLPTPTVTAAPVFVPVPAPLITVEGPPVGLAEAPRTGVVEVLAVPPAPHVMTTNIGAPVLVEPAPLLKAEPSVMSLSKVVRSFARVSSSSDSEDPVDVTVPETAPVFPGNSVARTLSIKPFSLKDLDNSSDRDSINDSPPRANSKVVPSAKPSSLGSLSTTTSSTPPTPKAVRNLSVSTPLVKSVSACSPEPHTFSLIRPAEFKDCSDEVKTPKLKHHFSDSDVSLTSSSKLSPLLATNSSGGKLIAVASPMKRRSSFDD